MGAGVSANASASKRDSSAGASSHSNELRGLRRFTVAQKTGHARAMEEVRSGRKATCWTWFVIPTPPFMVEGVEKGSALNKKFALRTDGEARAFLAFKADGVNLRANYLEIMAALRDQMRMGRSCTAIMGRDAPKVRSSARLFERLTAGGADEELHAVVSELLDLAC